MRSILVDTGVVIGLLDAADRFHVRSREFFAAVRPNDRLLTTWPVVTECAFALEHVRDEFYEWLLSGSLEIESFALADLDRMWRWMKGYGDRTVDLADASLVWLAIERRTNLIATTDFNDFETYRLPRRRAFRNLISRQ